MARFRLVPTKRFEDDFRDLPKRVQGQVLKALERIQVDPHHGRRLVNVTVGRWRSRVGDYRIRYDIEGQVVEYREEQERARLAERAAKTHGQTFNQTEQTFARFSFRGVLRMLALRPS